MYFAKNISKSKSVISLLLINLAEICRFVYCSVLIIKGFGEKEEKGKRKKEKKKKILGKIKLLAVKNHKN